LFLGVYTHLVCLVYGKIFSSIKKGFKVDLRF